MDEDLPDRIPEEWKYENPFSVPYDIKYNLPPFQQLYHHAPAQPQASLGTLALLPPELLQGMLTELDFLSLTNFQAINRQAFNVVNSIPEFKAIITHARPALQSIIAVHAGHLVKCKEFYDRMLFPECATCGDYGEYIYVLKCKRVCYLCLSYHQDYRPRSMQSVIRNFGLDRKVLKTLPCLKGIPGTYSPYKCDQRRRLTRYDSSAARSAGVILHGSEDAMSQHVLDVGTRQKAEYQRKLDHFVSKDATRCNGGVNMRGKPQRPAEDVFDQNEGNPLRWMGVVQVSSLHPVSRELEWDFRCAGCRECDNHSTHWTKRYTLSTFHDHIKRFGPIKEVGLDDYSKMRHTGMQYHEA